jgi:hypothetical protein
LLPLVRKNKDGLMDQLSKFPGTVTGVLNFAADRSFGGVFSNDAPELVRQRLRPVEVEIRNMRRMGRRPTLQQEGFTFLAHPTGPADWSNNQWIQSVYVPSCIELVKNVTGAKEAMSMHPPMLRRRGPMTTAGASPPANFIHVDQTRDAGRDTATRFAGSKGLSCERGAIYNVWKALTPPPQDLPLAIADWRTASEKDHVVGMSFEPVGPGRDKQVDVPHVCLAHSPEAPEWYYVPDLSADESLVFVGVDFDPSHPLGCPHSAFVQPDPNGCAVPRTSIEVRVMVFD